MEEVFNEHYRIGDDTFKVVLLIKRGEKFDAGMRPYHILEMQKLPEQMKYLYHKGEQGLDGKSTIIKADNNASLTWSDNANRELFNKITNQEIPGKFFLNPKIAKGFF